MNKKNKEKYLSIYYECLDGEYYNPSIEPLLEVLHHLVIGLEDDLSSDNTTNYFMDEDNNDNRRADFISKLINVFTRIVYDNKQDQVLDACKLFVHINKNWLVIPNELESFFYPQDAHLVDSHSYHSTWRNIISSYTYNEGYNAIDPKYFKAIPDNMKQVLDLFKEYRDSIILNNIDDVDRKTRFNGYMNVVIAYFHKEKYDINIFPKVLDYVYNHAYDLDEFYKLNTNENNRYALEGNIVSRIIEHCTGNTPVIK